MTKEPSPLAALLKARIFKLPSSVSLRDRQKLLLASRSRPHLLEDLPVPLATIFMQLETDAERLSFNLPDQVSVGSRKRETAMLLLPPFLLELIRLSELVCSHGSIVLAIEHLHWLTSRATSRSRGFACAGGHTVRFNLPVRIGIFEATRRLQLALLKHTAASSRNSPFSMADPMRDRSSSARHAEKRYHLPST